MTKEEEEKRIEEIAQAEFSAHYKQSVIYALFVLVFTTNILINVDHGTLPGCTA